MTATVTTLSDVLKRLYPQSYIERVLYKNNPLFGMVAKSENFYGEDMRLSLLYAPTAGRSATFSDAQGNKAGAKYSGFVITRAPDYSLFSVTGEAIRATRNDAGAQVRALKSEGDAALHVLERSLAISLYRNGGGAIGQVGSTSTTTLTLKNASDVTNFEVGMVIESDDTDGSGAGAADGEGITITGIDRDAGTLTAGSNWTGSGNFADDDYLFVEGDWGAKLTGLDGWVPATAPTSGDSFFSVDRSVDATRLGGIRYTATAATDGSVERSLINASARAKRQGAMPDVVFMNPLDWAVLVNEIGSKTIYDKTVARNAQGPVANIGYNALIVHGASGPMKVVADHNCPQDICYMLQMSTWKLYSLGPCPGWLNEDNNQILRESTADAYEGRMGCYAQLGCTAPGYNVRVNIGAVSG